MMLRKRTKKES